MRVAIVATQAAGRSDSLGALLRDSIDSHGWGERVSVSAIDLAGWAKAADDDASAALGDCLKGADLIVVDRGEAADLILETDAAEGKQVMALSDFFEDGSAERRALSEAGGDEKSFLDAAREAMPLLLRKIIAGRG